MRIESRIGLGLILGIFAVGLIFMGCEGEQGPPGQQGAQGPQGPGGPEGPEGPGGWDTTVYLGNNRVSCGHCHHNTTEEWEGTGHSEAWAALTDTTNLYCVQCHTTGFDDRYDHSGNLVSQGVNNGGYDDTRNPLLRNVQCEACHGPMGPIAATHVPQVASSYSGQTCSQCHPAWAEYITSGHANPMNTMTGEEIVEEWGGSTCDYCHISEAFIKKYDVDHASLTYDAETAHGVTCATCHDPHSVANPAQLRTVADVTSPYGGADFPNGYTITGLGNGQLCATCHHARRSQSQIMSQINNGSSRPGPHGSCQGDMVSGRGCYEVPGEEEYERENQHSTSMLGDMCVTCHIVTRGFGDPGGPAYGHTFKPQLSKCQACHSGAADFDIGGVQTETQAQLTALAALLPHDDQGNVLAAMDTINWTREQREAGYIYFFVTADKSLGVHNRDYTESLLANAIHYLQPGFYAEKRPGIRG